MDAPSIAITVQLLYKLGFNPIILVGQNLAYADNKHYAEGISYASGLRIDPVKTQGLIKTKDVEGKEVYTSLSFDRMRVGLEHHIKSMDGSKSLIRPGEVPILGEPPTVPWMN